MKTYNIEFYNPNKGFEDFFEDGGYDDVRDEGEFDWNKTSAKNNEYEDDIPF